MLPKHYTLIIAEKPKAALKIAYALSYGKSSKGALYKIPFWSFSKDGMWYVVASAAGHLFTLTTRDYEFPTFNYYWVPSWVANRSAKYTKPYYLALRKLCSNALAYINACDYDIEGSVIGYMIIRELGDLRKAYRMKFSTLTPQDLRYAFKNLMQGLDISMVEAGLCRHELDWIWGINVSRALMYAIRKVSGEKVILSAGRVQSPTLVEVVNTEIQRNLHVPLPIFNINVQVSINGKMFSLEFLEGSFSTISDAQKVLEKIRKERWGIVENVKYKSEVIKAPPPFNLGDLQAEASKIYGYSPMKTQEITEQLYLDALISYPRTNSQKLPPTINYKEILSKVETIPKYSSLISQLLSETKGVLKPREGAKTDPAHPAIYPTGLKPKTLKEDQEKIYDLIVRRFLATFATNTMLSTITIYIKISGYRFRLKLRAFKNIGWLKYYPFITIDAIRELPGIKKGQRIPVVKVRLITNYSKFQKTYSKASLLKWMETVNIGTESTRARIIESLFSRGYFKYIRGKIEVTPLGYAVSETLAKYFKDLTDVKLTRKFEELLDSIREGKNKRRDVVEESKKFLHSVLLEFKLKYSNKAGEDLAKSLKLIQPKKTCKICDREVVENNVLCKYHLMALEKMKTSFKKWKEAYKEISWEIYLNKISRLNISGKWIKEIAYAILKKKLETSTYRPKTS